METIIMEVLFMELKGSKTEKNLQTAFAGESQARNKYDYYASQAKKDGYVQIAAIFEETAKNEKEHAKMCPGGGLRGHREAVRGRRRHRKGARGALPQAAEEHRGRRGVLPRRRHDLAVQQLRPHRHRQAGPRGVPRVQPSPELFPDQGGELLRR